MPMPASNTLAIIGAGPIGLEAAAAALDHGFDVHVFEQGEVGSHPLAWGHVRMFTPWRTSIGEHARARLGAGGWAAPDPEACPTGLEFVERLRCHADATLRATRVVMISGTDAIHPCS